MHRNDTIVVVNSFFDGDAHLGTFFVLFFCHDPGPGLDLVMLVPVRYITCWCDLPAFILETLYRIYDVILVVIMYHLGLRFVGNLAPWLCRLPTTDSSVKAEGVYRSLMALQRSSRVFSTGSQGSSDVALACNVYISQGRDESLIKSLVDEITRVSHSFKGSHDGQKNSLTLGHIFVDSSYNRTGFTLVGSSVDAVAQGAAALSHKALSCIDLREHDATHPRLGVVDHISCHPLRRGWPGDMEIAGACAKEIGLILGDKYDVPTFLYGTCKQQQAGPDTSLASIRRRFGYFKAHGGARNRQEWQGLDDSWLDTMNSVIQDNPPDFGPNTVSANVGIACVGSVPWVINHNVILNTTNVDIAKQVAKKVSERGGGLKSVQAMGLEIDGGVEVACNLLDSEVSDCQMVDDFISKELAGSHKGVAIVKSYQTGKPVSQLLDMIR